MRSLNKILKSAGIVLLGILFSKVIGYTFRIIVGRRDIELYGLYNLAYVIVVFVIPFATLGLNQGIIRYVSYYNGKRNTKKSDIVISTALKIVLPTSLFLSFIFFTFSDSISSFFHTENISLILKFFAFLIPINSMGSIFGSILIANQRIVPVTLAREIIEPLLRLTIVVMAFSVGLNLLGVVVGLLIPSVVILVFLFLYSQKHFEFKFKGFDKELFIFSFPLLFVISINYAMESIDTIMLGYFTTISEVALYNSAFPTVTLLPIFGIALLSIFLPVITEKYAKKKPIANEYSSVTKWIFILILPFSTLMIFFGKGIISILFGHKYSSAGLALSILAFFYIFKSLCLPSRQILLMLKKTKQILSYFVAAFFLNIILNIILIPFFDKYYIHGMYGAAIATGLSLFFIAFFEIKLALKYTGLKLFNKNHFKALLCALISVSAIYIIYKFFSLQSSTHLIMLFTSSIILYTLFLFLFNVLEKQDKLILNRIKNKSISVISNFLERE